MITIYKYPLALCDGPQTVAIHRAAKILCVKNQREEITLWAIVDTSNPPEDRQFLVVGTGHPLGEYWKNYACSYLGTVLHHGGQLVWHIFEITA